MRWGGGNVLRSATMQKITNIQIAPGAIVRFGPRIGIVVGEIDHHLRGAY